MSEVWSWRLREALVVIGVPYYHADDDAMGVKREPANSFNKSGNF
jgi:hypothetical protein